VAKASLSEAIFDGLNAHGVEAKAKVVWDHICQHYPALVGKAGTSMFSATLSKERNRIRAGEKEPGQEVWIAPDEAQESPRTVDGSAECKATVDAVNEALADLRLIVGKVGKESVRRLLDII